MATVEVGEAATGATLTLQELVKTPLIDGQMMVAITSVTKQNQCEVML